MTIDKSREQEKLILRLSGRLDTATAPQLETELRASLADVRELVLDFSALEYISSAGLRVLLATHKTMKNQNGVMLVQGANEEILEVFTITGFSEILNVKRGTGAA